MTDMPCRFCGSPLRDTFADLGMSPLSNAYLEADQLEQMEPFYPLHAYTCGQCFLVQVGQFEPPERIFSDYAYFSSYSKSWLEHAEAYAGAMVARFGLDASSQVVEVASNDGYLLQYFQARGIPVLGVEPAENVARVAIEKGIPTEIRFFGMATATTLRDAGPMADLLVGNNVLAHVPDINDFVAGLKILLKPEGVITMEFPHLLRLMEGNQFDTIYHEHFSYLSFSTVTRVFAAHGLVLFDVAELPTHGGSLRIFAAHEGARRHRVQETVTALKATEEDAGLNRLETYSGFGEQVKATKRKLLSVLVGLKEAGKSIAGYGAAAKGNTLLNYCGIGEDFLDYVVDASPHKQNRYLPGTRLPIFAPGKIAETQPDYVLILAWNLREEIQEQMAHISDWGGRFVIPIPKVEVWP